MLAISNHLEVSGIAVSQQDILRLNSLIVLNSILLEVWLGDPETEQANHQIMLKIKSLTSIAVSKLVIVDRMSTFFTYTPPLWAAHLWIYLLKAFSLLFQH